MYSIHSTKLIKESLPLRPTNFTAIFNSRMQTNAYNFIRRCRGTCNITCTCSARSYSTVYLALLCLYLFISSAVVLMAVLTLSSGPYRESANIVFAPRSTLIRPSVYSLTRTSAIRQHTRRSPQSRADGEDHLISIRQTHTHTHTHTHIYIYICICVCQ